MIEKIIEKIIDQLKTDEEKKYAEEYYLWLTRPLNSDFDISVRIPLSITYPRAEEIQTLVKDLKRAQNNVRS